jgi:hypothetical protein
VRQGSGGGGVAKLLAVAAVAAVAGVAETCNSALFGFLICFFSEDADGDGQHDANLMDMKNTQLYSCSQMEGPVLCDVRLGLHGGCVTSQKT